MHYHGPTCVKSVFSDEKCPPESIIFGKSEVMAAIRRSLLKVADYQHSYPDRGESGTGKEIICKYLHRQSVWVADRSSR